MMTPKICNRISVKWGGQAVDRRWQIYSVVVQHVSYWISKEQMISFTRVQNKTKGHNYNKIWGVNCLSSLTITYLRLFAMSDQTLFLRKVKSNTSGSAWVYYLEQEHSGFVWWSEGGYPFTIYHSCSFSLWYISFVLVVKKKKDFMGKKMFEFGLHLANINLFVGI